MKKIRLLLLFLFLYPGIGFPQSNAEALVQEAADHVRAFFKNQAEARVAIVQFENDSELSDLAMQKIYQLLTARLEGDPNFKMFDLLVNFVNGRGEFNLSQAQELDYLLYLKFIQNKNKTGLGIILFSRWQDKLVSLKYIEKNLSQGEMDLLDVKNFAFPELGFSKLTEFEIKKNLMDVQSVSGADGQLEYYFYYPDEIVIYRAKGERLEKQSACKLNWTRPFYPVLNYQGKLLLFTARGGLTLTAGGNFSSYAQVLTFSENQWQETAKIGFVPFKLLVFNGSPYLVGARYDEGKNFFRDKIYFMPFSDPAVVSEIVEKKSFPAYAIDFSTREGQLQGVHLIDRDYRYHLLTGDLAEKSPEAERRGASLAASDDQWLAVSDYSRQTDQIFFYDITAGGQRPVYSGKIRGEIQFISAGVWQAVKGFWVCSRLSQADDEYGRSVIQFWGKRNE
ncbi:MAG: hypothetical protein NTZ12_04710 [Candidatus Aminicenantes bacterium]|nr:hypothetical protein [Candidatus Aminicenantes bacterium]